MASASSDDRSAASKSPVEIANLARRAWVIPASTLPDSEFLINNSSRCAAEKYNAAGFIVKTDLKLKDFVPEVKKRLAVA